MTGVQTCALPISKDLQATIDTAPPWPSKPSARELGPTVSVQGEITLKKDLVISGVFPDKVESGAALQMAAELPDGSVIPLLWLYDYQPDFGHAFLFSEPVRLPAGTRIHGIPGANRVQLLPLKTK